MDAVDLMISITNREELPELTGIYQKNHVDYSLISLGHGTARIDSTPKAVTYSVITRETWLRVRHMLEVKMEIDLPDKGIVFTVPLSGVGGMKQLKALLGSQEFTKEEETVLKNTKYELVIAIANPGYSDQMMQAARSAGAKGGTVLHARGTGENGSAAFYGITLAGEKEMLYTVVRSEIKTEVMKAIMEQCGLETKAEAVVISLPVTATAGMRFYEMKEAKNEIEDGESFAGDKDGEN